MTWFKVDDKFHDHRKSRRAKKAAIGVWTLAGSWCADNLTDGFVPEHVLNRWGSRRDATQLCEANLWIPAEKDGEKGWQFVNWTDFQPSKAEVESEREATKERVKKWRAARKGNAVTPAVTNGVTNGDVTPGVQVPRPDPSRPDPSIRAHKRATQLPDDWQPSERHGVIAAERGVDLGEEADKFRDWCKANGSTKKDWEAAFRNWLRNARPTGNVRPFPQPDEQGRIPLGPLPPRSPWGQA